MNSKSIFLLVSSIITFFLSACSNMAPERNYCPNYALISDLDRIPIITTTSRHGELRLMRIAAKCQGDYMEMNLQTQLHLDDKDTNIIAKEIPFFIAVVDNKENVINRQDFVLKVKATGPYEVQVYKQNYSLIPSFDWKTMKLLVGLSLTPEQRQQNALAKAQHEQALAADLHSRQKAKIKRLAVR